MAKYRALIGFNYPDPDGGDEIRVEAGDSTDLPDKIVKDLLADGVIENVAKATAKHAAAGGED